MQINSFKTKLEKRPGSKDNKSVKRGKTGNMQHSVNTVIRINVSGNGGN
jgi:hypothetical protein